MAEHKILINGEWKKSSSGEVFESINPATKKSLGTFQKGTKEDVKSAVDAAEDAFDKWSETPAPQRAEILFKTAEILKQRKEELGKLVTTEMGKVISEGLGDVQEAIDIAEYMAGEGRRLFGYTTPSELPNKFAMTLRVPVGVMGLIAPWNFPIAIPAWKLMPALVCGNTVVFKPATDTPLCAIELVKILEKAGLPKGVVNLVTGPGGEVGEAILDSKKIRGISFTGSKEVGEHITKKVGVRKLGLELGGKNAIIVMDDAKLDLAVEGILFGGYGTTGQRCTASSRVIVHEKVKGKLEKMLVERVKKLKVGNGIDSKTDVGPLINQKAVDKTHKYTEIGKKEGAKLLVGGKVGSDKGFFYEPTLFTNVAPSMRIAQEEIFGPVVSMISAKDLKDAIKICNGVEYGLSSAIYTENMRNAFTAIKKIEAGLTYVNSSTIGAEAHLPFGGVKGTGNGTREAGIEGIHEFSETKTVYFDYSGKLQKAQIDVD
ncbi:MAG: aldehyde dehydrogenase family protein [archaeon]